MTDERQGEAVWPALDALPKGSGVVFRHYSLSRQDRLAMGRRVGTLASERSLKLVAAGPEPFAREIAADGYHHRSRHSGSSGMIRTMSVHNEGELSVAISANADLIFVSPVFPTQSHREAEPLGPERLSAIVRKAPMPVIALGGMTAARAEVLKAAGIYGWAAIGALTPDANEDLPD